MDMKKTVTTVVVVFVAVCVICAMWIPAQAAELISVYVNGRKVNFPDAPAYLDENGRTQVPVRFVVEALGCAVEWDNVNQYVTINGNGTTVLFMIGQKIYKVNGVTMPAMDTEAVLNDSRTYVPVRFAAEALGATVRWDNDTRSVYVDIAGVEGADGGGVTDDNGEQPEDDEEQANSVRVTVYEDYMFDEYGYLITKYAEPLYQELLDSMKIIYEDGIPYFCYSVPENLPDNTEFGLVLRTDLKNSAPRDVDSWLYQSNEIWEGDRALGRDYLLPASGVVKKAMSPTELKYFDNILVGIELISPPGATWQEYKLVAHPSWQVVIIPDNSRDSYIRKSELNRFDNHMPGSPSYVPLDPGSIIKYN